MDNKEKNNNGIVKFCKENKVIALLSLCVVLAVAALVVAIVGRFSKPSEGEGETDGADETETVAESETEDRNIDGDINIDFGSF